MSQQTLVGLSAQVEQGVRVRVREERPLGGAAVVGEEGLHLCVLSGERVGEHEASLHGIGLGHGSQCLCLCVGQGERGRGVHMVTQEWGRDEGGQHSFCLRAGVSEALLLPDVTCPPKRANQLISQEAGQGRSC